MVESTRRMACCARLTAFSLAGAAALGGVFAPCQAGASTVWIDPNVTVSGEAAQKFGPQIAGLARDRVASAFLSAGMQAVSSRDVAHDIDARIAIDALDDSFSFNRAGRYRSGSVSITLDAGGTILAQVRKNWESDDIYDYAGMPLQRVIDSMIKEMVESGRVRGFVQRAAARPAPVAAAALATPAPAAGPVAGVGGARRVAVLEFRGPLDLAVLAAITDEARGAAAEGLRPGGAAVMTRENLLVMLKDMGKAAACSEGECEVETGRLVGADLVVTGEVIRVDTTYVLILKLHETAGGSLVATRQARGRDALELLGSVKAAAATLFR